MKILAYHAHAQDPLSFLIKAITRSCYCHGAILIEGEWRAKVAEHFGIPGEGHLIIEAIWPKVHARLLGAEQLAYIDVFEVPSFTAEMEAKAIEWLVAQVDAGIAYDVTDLLRFVPQARAIIGETKNDAYKIHTFCSMLVFNAYRFAGLPLLNCHDYEFSPDKMAWSPFVTPSPKLA